MIVLCDNKMYELDMPFELFQSFKQSSPTLEVELLSISSSSYRELKKAPLQKVEDWSVARNMQALQN